MESSKSNKRVAPNAPQPSQRSMHLEVLKYSIAIGVALASIGIGLVYIWFEQQQYQEKPAIKKTQPFLHDELTEEEAEKLDQLQNRYMSWDYNWDGMHDAAQAGREQYIFYTADGTKLVFPQFGAAVHHLFLVRHGQYNLQGTVDDERWLTDLGRQQAAMTGARLAAEGYPFRIIRHSNMRRAIETAEIIRQFLNESIPVSMDEKLAEGMPVVPDPNELGQQRNETLLGPDGFRMEDAFRKYFHRAPPSQVGDSYELIVCHANVIRFLVCRALQLPPEGWMRFGLRHASITWISILPNGHVLLRMFGEAGYMPIGRISE